MEIRRYCGAANPDGSRRCCVLSKDHRNDHRSMVGDKWPNEKPQPGKEN